jgi:predicted amidohydrolase
MRNSVIAGNKGSAFMFRESLLNICFHADSNKKKTDTLKVASIQLRVTGNIAENLARMETWFEKAMEENPRVVLFPETILSGFNEAAIRELDFEALEQAMRRLSGLAKKHGVYIIYGTATSSGREKPFNSAVVLDPEGREITRYHKSIPEDWFEAGTHLALFDIDGIPCTLIICHDNRFPELVRIPVLAGARICFYISYEVNQIGIAKEKRANYRAQAIGRAAENGIWFAQSNGIGPEGEEMLSMSNSIIVDPLGVVIAEAPELEEHLMTAVIEPAQADRRNARESLKNRYLAGWWREAAAQLEAVESGFAAACQPKPADGSTIRIAIMQDRPEPGDVQANFNTFLDRLDQAAGADFFVTPECWLDGRTETYIPGTETLHHTAQDIDASPCLGRVAGEAAKRNMYICFAFTSIENDTFYNTAGLWSPDGERIGLYRKTHLEDRESACAAGNELPALDTRHGKLGLLLGAETGSPEAVRTLRLKGARILLNPAAGAFSETRESTIRIRARENRIFIAAAHSRAGFVAEPEGGLAAKRADMPGVLLCDIGLAEAKDDNHIRGRRPDLYDIIVKEE